LVQVTAISGSSGAMRLTSPASAGPSFVPRSNAYLRVGTATDHGPMLLQQQTGGIARGFLTFGDIKLDVLRVKCTKCDRQPMEIGVMKAGKLNEHDAADILCSVCRLVVATLLRDPAVRVRASP
jgi:hypothetical protein